MNNESVTRKDILKQITEELGFYESFRPREFAEVFAVLFGSKVILKSKDHYKVGWLGTDQEGRFVLFCEKETFPIPLTTVSLELFSCPYYTKGKYKIIDGCGIGYESGRCGISNKPITIKECWKCMSTQDVRTFLSDDLKKFFENTDPKLLDLLQELKEG